MNLNQILNKNCIEGMKEIKNNSFDLILTDPPYQISKESQFSTLKDRKNARTGTYFGEWDENFDNEPWIKEASRVLKSGGSLLVFNDIKKISIIIEIAEKYGLQYKDTIIWKKTNPMPRNRDRRYVQDIESVIWFVKPKSPWTFNRQKENFESCIKCYPSESGGAFKRIHPTQKPLKLIEDLLLIHSNEGDLVLDCFSGSGTVAIACKKNKRNFIAFELDELYYKKSIERLNLYE